MMRRATSRLETLSRWGLPALLVAITLLVYGSSLRFGLIWDDPLAYLRVARQPLWQAFVSSPTYPFYRPLAALYAHLLVTPAGRVNAPLAHTLQIGVQALVVWLSVPALRALGFEVWPARLAALLMALFPLAYQAIAWQAPQQPWAMAGLLVAVVAARQYQRHSRRRFLALSLLAYAGALLFQECALPFAGLFVWLGLRQWQSHRARPLWPLLHVGLAGLYFLIWLSLPRASGATGQALQPVVLAYLLQGFTYPFVPWLGPWVKDWSPLNLGALFTAVGLGLALVAWRRGARLPVLLSLGWVAAGFLPVWVGLGWVHVEIGSRLYYPAALGLAGLWALALMRLFSARALWARGLASVALAAMAAGSLWQLRQFQQLYAAGTAHLAEAVTALSAAPGQQLLFVNFPDRLELRSASYPLGFWGLTLAPVVQHLSDYALAATGQSATDVSLSAVAGADARGAWRYRVDRRGVEAAPEAIYQAAWQADAVYLTDYLPGGRLRLRAVGQVRPAGAEAANRQVGDFARLVQAKISAGEALTLTLTWHCLKTPLAGDTIFVHLWQGDTFVGGVDGASLGDLVPLSAWQPGVDIVDRRRVELASLEPGHYEVRVGVYNLVTGARYPAAGPEGLYPAEEVPIGDFDLPLTH